MMREGEKGRGRRRGSGRVTERDYQAVGTRLKRIICECQVVAVLVKEDL